MQKNKNTILVIIGLAVIVLVAMAVIKNNKKVVEPVVVNDQAVEQVNEDVATGAVVIKPTKNSISYQQALIKYKDHRIQLGQDCQATPTKITYKNGTSIMIDNRSNTARTVKVGSSYTIPAWSFKVVNLTSSTLPATWLVDCGKQQNVATILIQK